MRSWWTAESLLTRLFRVIVDSHVIVVDHKYLAESLLTHSFIRVVVDSRDRC